MTCLKLVVITLLTGFIPVVIAQPLLWEENFGTDDSCGILSADGFTTSNGTWTVEMSGPNGVAHHEWYVSAREAGLDNLQCGNGCSDDPDLEKRTLFISRDTFSDIDGADFEHAANAETDLRVVSPVIDMSDVDFELTLEFSYIFGDHPSSSCFLQYYDGNAWSDLTEIETTIGDCGPAGEWTTALVTFPSSAQNNPDVRIAFRWVNAGTDYMLFPELSFAVSEVQCLATDSGSGISDLVISHAKYGSYDAATDSTWKNLEYTEYHYCQVRPLDLSATAKNIGTVDQTNVYLAVNINDGEGFDETISSVSTDIAVGDSVQLAIDDYLPPNEPGEYVLTYTLHQDQTDSIPENNSTTRNYKVHTSDFYIYGSYYDVYPMARDDGYPIAASDSVTGDIYMAGTAFHLTAPAEICCMGAAIMGDFVNGNGFTFSLYDNNFDYIHETELGFVSNEMEYDTTDMNFTWLPMDYYPVPITSETDVIAAFVNYFYQDTLQSIKIGVSDFEAPESSSFVMAEWLGPDSIVWEESDATYMIRLGLSSDFCSTAIAEVANHINNLSCAPNPSAGEVTVQFDLIEQSDVQLFLFDYMGRVMHKEELGSLSTGSYRYQYNWSNLAAGMYTVTIASDGKAMTKKLIIE